MIDEVNRMLNEGLSGYLNEQDIRFLGNPLPVPQDDINWDSELLSFDFELGLSPELSLDLSLLEVEKPTATVSDSEIEEELKKLDAKIEEAKE
jgi:trigger factor